MFWTEDRIETLKAMATDGKSFGQVAEALGCTRNMVAGKAARLGVSFHSSAATHAERVSAGQRRAWADDEKRQRRMDLSWITRGALNV